MNTLRLMARLGLLFAVIELAGCAALGEIVSGEFPTAGDAAVAYVEEFCDPVVVEQERAEILAELNAATAPHRIAIECAAP